MEADRWIVITSINRPTRAVEVISDLCRKGWRAVVVGDTKTPADWAAPGIDYLSVDRQKQLFGAYADLIPYRHYCRKNLGYLHAIQNGAQLIVDTDDDNIPYDTFGHGIKRLVNGRMLAGPGWVNIYKHFISDLQIWPRGLPLDAINETGVLSKHSAPMECPIQQYLADNDPDVDAIFRLTTQGEFFFRKNEMPVILDRECWVPFNSQNTVFFADAFPLLYLPCHVSFRMTDIWRSFVAQAALSHQRLHVSFHAPTVEQIRNVHDLMKDFADEVVGYLDNRRIGRALSETIDRLNPDMPLAAVALRLWQALQAVGIIQSAEMELIERWFEVLGSATAGRLPR